MKTVLRIRIADVRGLHNIAERTNASIALVRIVLQHVCISLAEWCMFRHQFAIAQGSIPQLSCLRKPTDGAIVELLHDLLIYADNLGWAGIAPIMSSRVGHDESCQRFSTSRSQRLYDVMTGFCAWRNASVAGHGIPGDEDPDAILSLASVLIDRFASLLPEAMAQEPDGTQPLQLRHPQGDLMLSLLRMKHGDPVCILSITPYRGNTLCTVKAQRQVNIRDRKAFEWHAHDIIASLEREFAGYGAMRTYDPEWTPLFEMPSRQTDTFCGRANELKHMSEWMDDAESRACLLHGDGGVGKTTLLLQFVHSMIEGQFPRIRWKPDLITYFTAKKTRWGMNGLENINYQDMGIISVVHEIARGFEPRGLDRSWYRLDARQAIARISQLLADFGIKRQSHLLIIDNAETMASTVEDAESLAVHVRLLTQRVGRVMITSRRAERIEARQIQVERMPIEDALSLIRQRGLSDGCAAIRDAGDRTLRRYARGMQCTPLLLEVFVKSAAKSNGSLESAYNEVRYMLQEDLGSFLFLDAWGRFSRGIRSLFVLMTQASENHDGLLFTVCCEQCGVSCLDAENAIRESRGIASILQSSGQFQVAFSRNFVEFCRNAHGGRLECDVPSARDIDEVLAEYGRRRTAADAHVVADVGKAYRTEEARLARDIARSGEVRDAIIAFDDAVAADPANAELLTKYGEFVVRNGSLNEARRILERATGVDPNCRDAWLNRGRIEAMLGLHEDSDRAFVRHAVPLGVSQSSAWVAQAYAYWGGRRSERELAQRALAKATKAICSEKDRMAVRELEALLV